MVTNGSSSIKVKGDIDLLPGRFKKYIDLHGIKNYKLQKEEILIHRN